MTLPARSIAVAFGGSALLLALALACEPVEGGSVDVIDLGSVSISDTGDYSGAIEVDVPPDATSVVAYCGGFGDDSLGAVWTLNDPAGTTVYDGDAGDVSQFRSDFLDDLSPALLPVSPRLPVSEGIWSFDWFVGAGNGGSIDCGAVVRTGEVGPEATIGVEVVFVGVDIDASTAPDDPNWQVAMDTFTGEWETAGISVDVSYSDFTGNVDRFQIVDVSDDDYSEFNDLLRTADPVDPRTITFFIVEEISNASGGGSTILGLSAGPPGAATLSTTSKSGVIVSGIDIADAPVDVGKIMAHEGGHFLGLFHTTERDGSMTDPLDDTPECNNDGDNNGTLTNAECAGSGPGNVMWWTLSDGSSTLSADQGWVARRNPVAR